MRFKTTRTTEGQANAHLRKNFLNEIGGAILPNQLISLDGKIGHYVNRMIDEQEKEVKVSIYQDANKGTPRALPEQVIIGSLQYKLVVAIVAKPEQEYKPWIAPKKDAVTPAAY